MDEDPNMYVFFLLRFLKFQFFSSFYWWWILIYEWINRVKYIEQELAKKRGRNIDAEDQVENELKRAEDELYTIPDHLKVSFFCLFNFSY
jgi:hypothetical protein